MYLTQCLLYKVYPAEVEAELQPFFEISLCYSIQVF